MTFAQLTDRINRDLGEKMIIFMVCDCSIDYNGRSRSEIGRGHRIVIIKHDTTMLVHTLTGFKPVNWMSSPTQTTAEEHEGILLYSQRTKKPFEEIKVQVHEVIDYQSYPNLEDNGKIDITHTEKDLQDYLIKNPQKVHPGFRLKKAEYPTPLGFFDLYGKIEDKYVVVELKAERAGLPAALQIKRYYEWLSQNTPQAQGILMAPGITQNAYMVLEDAGIEFKKIDVRKLKIKHRKEKTLDCWC